MITFEDLQSRKEKLCVVGLGYVGLPLAVLLAEKFDVIGFDVNEEKIARLKQGKDVTGEVSDEALAKSTMEFTDDKEQLRQAKFFVLAIPTPVDEQKKPDLRLLEKASEMVGEFLSKGSIVMFESTVFPGATEEICIPAIERSSNMKHLDDFCVGYSPERVNPGDKEHTIDKIIKVVSGSNQETLDTAAKVYSTICTAGIHKAPSIKVAEAAKVIENAQRDLNIAFTNELSLIFHRMGISTKDVLDAAGTKWNFLKFSPGLVGGHCIGVDPFYLTYRAKQLGYDPRVILAGREINDWMPRFIAEELVTHMNVHDQVQAEQLKVTMLGITFKENIPDVRNSKAAELCQILKHMGVQVNVIDPHADSSELEHEYGISLSTKEQCADSNVVIFATAHDEFIEWGTKWIQSLFGESTKLFMDVRNAYDPAQFTDQGIEYWAL